jgi:hypothetical protein
MTVLTLPHARITLGDGQLGIGSSTRWLFQTACKGLLMAKSSPEKLAKALRDNLKRRKDKPAAAPPANQAGQPRKAPRQSPENPPKNSA